MKINPGYTLKTISGQATVTAESPAAPLRNTIVLNETSAFLWEQIASGITSKEQLLHSLLARFDISTVLALNDINVFLKTMRENGIIEL